ncbi:serine hydrolase domain-containing protein [Pseudodonghicola flavimaris]|uniref:Serine hydrolase domain-containing protein n=1 Tax=Pseudodonghicola flavimaris TaxID=3050036 RepID=A0ABT7EZ28_9RHOB|nr:serine hydrolase domain-containing protein [Pseudodonghicola flavimaris]MDK3017590.1 serine hydrolase domain-containing protein [Pseudodonghicola flavimaris]
MEFSMDAVRDGYPLAAFQRLCAAATVPELLKAGDVAAMWNVNVARFFRTALLCSPHGPGGLEEAPCPDIGGIVASPELGRFSLDAYLEQPAARMQGICVIHAGRIVYERYPLMRREQPHLWASCAKPLAGLAIELLIEDGCLDEERGFGAYMPEFRDTAWADIRIRDAMDMTPGLDCEENDETRADPDSIAIRAFLAEFGSAHRGRVETLRQVLRHVTPLRPAGTRFEYGSPTTQMLVLLAEAVSGRDWSQFMEERVWRHLRVDGPLQMHLSPDGVALAHGIASSTLRDMARFGMLYTPSWSRISDTEVVRPATLARIRDRMRPRAFFMAGHDGKVFSDRFADDSILGASRQWDCLWADGDMYKGGMMGQALYVSPGRDLVIAFFSTRADMSSVRYLRPIATSGLFGD